MRRSAFIVVSVAVAALSFFIAPGTAQAAQPQRTSTANWAGHLLSRAPAQPSLTESVMRLRVPTVDCRSARRAEGPAMVSIWNGLGGWHGDVLYQAGIEATCAPGNDTPQYDAFYEVVRPDTWPGTDLVPHAVFTPLALYTVAAGDVITSRVQVSGAAASFVLTDAASTTQAATPKVRWQVSARMPIAAAGAAPRTAECIVERPALTDPAGHTSLAPLPDFHAAFNSPADRCTVSDSAGHSTALGTRTSRWTQTTVDMRDSTSAPLLATARPLTSGSRQALTVLWNRSS